MCIVRLPGKYRGSSGVKRTHTGVKFKVGISAAVIVGIGGSLRRINKASSSKCACFLSSKKCAR